MKNTEEKMSDSKCVVKPLSLRPETVKNISVYSDYLDTSHSHFVDVILSDIFKTYSTKQLLSLFKPIGLLKLDI